ncbi:MAG: hypothetical protein KY475_12280 [Planctomycetes bacterium]|nr:hypothetical protein [Planctomycetota bacterium]
MNTFVLSSDNVAIPVKALIDNLGSDEIRICDESGNVLAYLTPPSARDETLYAEAQAWARANQDILRQRSSRRGGMTTAELCQRVGMTYQGDSGEEE